MKQIVNLTLQSEYSFKQAFAHTEKLAEHTNNTGFLGVADINNTFAHYPFEKMCKENDIKPIFGVRLMVVDKPEEKVRGRSGPEYIFIAKNRDGLKEIYELTKTAYDKFYYKAQIGISDMLVVSDNVFVISECPVSFERLDYIGLSPSTPYMVADNDFPKVAIQRNRYLSALDKKTYQLIAGARRSGRGLNYLYNSQTYPQHVLSTEEWFRIWGDEEAIENTWKIAEQCDVEIPNAPMVKYNGKENLDKLSIKGALKLGIDLDDPKYKERFEKELSVIKEKDFGDYFLIVADMVLDAKNKMLVGPARGSAAGSLICYLMGITTVDPVKHGLIFERFVDLNREDFPDIDVDFPDTKRQTVIKNLVKKFNGENVCHISNVNKFKAKTAINEISMSLSIPKWEADLVKESIVDRSGGDARAKIAAYDTITGTDVGKEFLENYPEAIRIAEVEGHASHAGKHAAGIIVCNSEITNYGGVNSREGTIMMDKKGAESKNLLKIDALGLRTLSVLMEAADLIGMKYSDFYKLPLHDEKTFDIFNEMRVFGVFQFEGRAMYMLCEAMGVQNFDDICALTALARPGPLHSGAANTYIRRRTGEDKVEYACNHPMYIEETEKTQGVIVYQEQLMRLCRTMGDMSWGDVSAIRKAASKTMGADFFNQYKQKFLDGCKKNDVDYEQAREVWESMISFGSWAMNKSHSVSYGYISYWCAYMKAHHPLEFTAANLNHARSEDSAINILRDAVENDGIEYDPVDPDVSGVKWSSASGRLVGGLTNIHGIGDSKAKDIIRKREKNERFTPAVISKLIDPKTPYDILYPTEHYFGEYYRDYKDYGLLNPPSYIKDIKEAGQYFLLGRVNSKDLRDLNEYNELMKRGGKVWQTHNKDLRLIVEDDTSQILCKINRFDFDKMGGSELYETLFEEKSYVIIRGVVKEGWRMIHIKAIHEIGKVDKIEGLLEKA